MSQDDDHDSSKRPLSDCIPHRDDLAFRSDSPCPADCQDPTCRATHAGHHPYRHSVSCTLNREAQEKFGAGSAEDSANEASARRNTMPFAHRDVSLDMPKPVVSYRSSILSTATEPCTDGMTNRRYSVVDFSEQGSVKHLVLLKHLPQSPEGRPARPDIPKVRVISPPDWLRRPSHVPGKIEGRLRRVESRSTPHVVNRLGSFSMVPFLGDSTASDLEEARARLRPTAPRTSTAEDRVDSGLRRSR